MEILSQPTKQFLKQEKTPLAGQSATLAAINMRQSLSRVILQRLASDYKIE